MLVPLAQQHSRPIANDGRFFREIQRSLASAAGAK
jgi:hypothetical protein